MTMRLMGNGPGSVEDLEVKLIDDARVCEANW